MLVKEQNDYVTLTGPGTPMGQLFRSYWIPALLASELPAPDCAPVRVELLSEKLVAFRDTQGRLGLIDEFCAHRRVSLWFGRNEESGLRCPYHGWKFDVTGQCVDIPSELPGSTHCQRIRMVNYPLVEKGGILWTYMGPPDRRPALPEWEFTNVPDTHRFVSKRWQECNWLQALEGGIDSSHVSFLHRGDLETDPVFKGAKGNKYNMGDLMPVFDVVESPGGLYIGARRNAENGNYYWRITQWVMPAFTMIPPRGDHPVHGHFFIPRDDENCWTWSFDYRVKTPLEPELVQQMREGAGIHTVVDSHFRPLANKDNDYLIDRDSQKRGRTYSGVSGFAIQDSSLQESMGPIIDRSKENLVATDKGIVMARRRLMRAAKALLDSGTVPPGVDPAHTRVRSAAVVLPPDKPFAEAIGDALAAREGAAHVSV
ncbi:MAG TPA: Rieske 2Fe-2S domain-containing protein [Micropepsaceae bacterium]|jgi:phenylpropionate dioxygenase-like ring-hydroxylating dioxygenase large terminal subunit|nr:Rieske 2Fe-2S domain-containing protein [Micropepsaceae bacterium]